MNTFQTIVPPDFNSDDEFDINPVIMKEAQNVTEIRYVCACVRVRERDI